MRRDWGQTNGFGGALCVVGTRTPGRVMDSQGEAVRETRKI